MAELRLVGYTAPYAGFTPDEFPVGFADPFNGLGIWVHIVLPLRYY